MQKVFALVMLCSAVANEPAQALAAQEYELLEKARSAGSAVASTSQPRSQPYRSHAAPHNAVKYSQNISANVKSNHPNPKPTDPSPEPGTLAISAELKQAIRDIIAGEKTEEESPTFDIAPGALVPSSVKLHPFPPTVVEIVPTHRSYQYFVVIDRRVVIVNPSTRVIAFVLGP
jgi:hypothetical protein